MKYKNVDQFPTVKFDKNTHRMIATPTEYAAYTLDPNTGLDHTVGFYSWSHVDDKSTQSPKALLAAAKRCREIAAFFKANPKRWCQGSETATMGDIHQMCFIGAWNRPKIAGLTSLGNSGGKRVLDTKSPIIGANDDAPSLAHFLKFLDSYANVLERFSLTDRTYKSWLNVVNQERLRIMNRAAQVKAYKTAAKVH